MNLKKNIYRRAANLLAFSLSLLPLGHAHAVGPANSGSATIMSFLPMLAIFAIMYLLLIRPQMRTNKERQKMVAGLKKGDKVLTSGGLYGTIVNVRGDVLDLKLAENLKVECHRQFISRVITASAQVSQNEQPANPIVKSG